MPRRREQIPDDGELEYECECGTRIHKHRMIFKTNICDDCKEEIELWDKTEWWTE